MKDRPDERMDERDVVQVMPRGCSFDAATRSSQSMSQAKPWQIAVVALGLLGGVGGVVYAVRSNPGIELASSVPMVDVITGELFDFEIPKKGSLVFPEINPATGKETLFPVIKDEAGNWKLAERYAGGLQDLKMKPEELAVDRATGAVRVKDGKPKRISR